ncbi:MAG: inositol monophosphatase family protein [Ignavibacteriaceae bacterium]|nr:inositol monophosphatase family protein [Ignavibacteriaceae bacterium]
MLNKIIEIAKEAGEIVQEGFGKTINIEFKTNESNLVTQVDKASEKRIIDFVKKEFPTHGILAEESGETKNSSEYLWVVDPLDGTTNFAHGFPIFSVSIGVQKKGLTIAGVVYDVMQDIVYSAESGGGAYSNGNKIKVNSNDLLQRALLVTGFPYNIAENPENAFERFTALTKASRGMRRLGSAAIDFCYVANGVFDGFWEIYLHPWDICAGKLILEEAGGIVTGFGGESIDIFSNKILASNNRIHNQLMEVINKF